MAARRRSPFAPAPVATDRQQEFLDAVQALTGELGRAPNAAEVGKRLGITRRGARLQLQALAAKGLVVDVPKVVSSGQWALCAPPKPR